MATAAASLAAAVGIVWRRRRAPPLEPPLPDYPASTVLLPVRDEEEIVGACLDSLLAQRPRPRIRVIDDGSRDATAALVRGRGAEVELIEAGDLPAGWTGKLHALARGLAGVESPWLLLTDADTRHAPDLLARSHATARRHGLDLLSLAGRQRVRTLGEALITPLVFALLDAELGDWPAAAEGRRLPPVANGQFLLVRRAALERAGGLEAIRSAPLDDLALAQRLAAHGSRCGFVRALGELEIRMYCGFASTWDGWRRNLATLYGRRPLARRAAITCLLAPAVAASLAAAAGRPFAIALCWAAGVLASALVRATALSSPWPGLLYPLDAALTSTLLAVAARDARRGRLARWKGRELPPTAQASSAAGESEPS